MFGWKQNLENFKTGRVPLSLSISAFETMTTKEVLFSGASSTRSISIEKKSYQKKKMKKREFFDYSLFLINRYRRSYESQLEMNISERIKIKSFFFLVHSIIGLLQALDFPSRPFPFYLVSFLLRIEQNRNLGWSLKR